MPNDIDPVTQRPRRSANVNKNLMRDPDELVSSWKPNISKDDMKKYDIPVHRKIDHRQLASERQSLRTQLARTVGNVAANIPLGVVESTGYLAELFDGSRDYNNAAIEWAERNKNPFDRVYVKDPNALAELSTGYALNTIGGLVESIAQFGLTGGGIGGAVGLGVKSVGMAAKATKTALKLASITKKGMGVSKYGVAASRASASWGLAYVEGAMTGKQVYTDLYDKLIIQGYTEDEAHRMSGNGAQATTRINTIVNGIPNMIGMSAVMGRSVPNFAARVKAYSPTSGLSRQAHKRLSKVMEKYGSVHDTDKVIGAIEDAAKAGNKVNRLKSAGLIGIEATFEGIEEIVNVFAQEAGMRIGESGEEATLLAMFGQRGKFFDDTMTGEGALSFILGAFGGAGQGVVMNNIAPMYNDMTLKDAQGNTVYKKATEGQTADKHGFALDDNNQRIPEMNPNAETRLGGLAAKVGINRLSGISTSGKVNRKRHQEALDIVANALIEDLQTLRTNTNRIGELNKKMADPNQTMTDDDINELSKIKMEMANAVSFASIENGTSGHMAEVYQSLSELDNKTDIRKSIKADIKTAEEELAQLGEDATDISRDAIKAEIKALEGRLTSFDEQYGDKIVTEAMANNLADKAGDNSQLEMMAHLSKVMVQLDRFNQSYQNKLTDHQGFIELSFALKRKHNELTARYGLNRYKKLVDEHRTKETGKTGSKSNLLLEKANALDPNDTSGNDSFLTMDEMNNFFEKAVYSVEISRMQDRDIRKMEEKAAKTEDKVKREEFRAQIDEMKEEHAKAYAEALAEAEEAYKVLEKAGMKATKEEVFNEMFEDVEDFGKYVGNVVYAMHYKKQLDSAKQDLRLFELRSKDNMGFWDKLLKGTKSTKAAFEKYEANEARKKVAGENLTTDAVKQEEIKMLNYKKKRFKVAAEALIAKGDDIIINGINYGKATKVMISDIDSDNEFMSVVTEDGRVLRASTVDKLIEMGEDAIHSLVKENINSHMVSLFSITLANNKITDHVSAEAFINELHAALDVMVKDPGYTEFEKLFLNANNVKVIASIRTALRNTIYMQGSETKDLNRFLKAKKMTVEKLANAVGLQVVSGNLNQHPDIQRIQAIDSSPDTALGLLLEMFNNEFDIMSNEIDESNPDTQYNTMENAHFFTGANGKAYSYTEVMNMHKSNLEKKKTSKKDKGVRTTATNEGMHTTVKTPRDRAVDLEETNTELEESLKKKLAELFPEVEVGEYSPEAAAEAKKDVEKEVQEKKEEKAKVEVESKPMTEMELDEKIEALKYNIEQLQEIKQARIDILLDNGALLANAITLGEKEFNEADGGSNARTLAKMEADLDALLIEENDLNVAAFNANKPVETRPIVQVPVGWSEGKTVTAPGMEKTNDFKPGLTVLPNGNVLVKAFRTGDTGLGSKGVAQRGEGLYLSLTNPYPGKDVNTIEFEMSPSEIVTYKEGSEFEGTIHYNKLNGAKGDSFHARVKDVKGKAFIGGINTAEDSNLELVLYDEALIKKAEASKKKIADVSSGNKFYDLVEVAPEAADNTIAEEGLNRKAKEQTKREAARVTEAKAEGAPKINTVNTHTTADITKIKNEIKGLKFTERIRALFDKGIIASNKTMVLGKRYPIIININGVKIPFYRSSEGTGGKAKGKWTPMFGMGVEGDNEWFIKGSIDSVNDNYDSEAIALYAELLNETLNWDHNSDSGKVSEHAYLKDFLVSTSEAEFNKEVHGVADLKVANKTGGATAPLPFVKAHVEKVNNAFNKVNNKESDIEIESEAEESNVLDGTDKEMDGTHRDDIYFDDGKTWVRIYGLDGSGNSVEDAKDAVEFGIAVRDVKTDEHVFDERTDGVYPSTIKEAMKIADEIITERDEKASKNPEPMFMPEPEAEESVKTEPEVKAPTDVTTEEKIADIEAARKKELAAIEELKKEEIRIAAEEKATRETKAKAAAEEKAAKEALKKAEAERIQIAKENAEADALAKELALKEKKEQDRIKKEKARVAKEEAKRVADIKAKAKKEAARVAKELKDANTAEKKRKADEKRKADKEKKDRIKAEAAEAKLKADTLAKENVEKERKIQEQLAKDKADREAKVKAELEEAKKVAEEKERLEQERIAKEKIAAEARLAKDLAATKDEADRIEKERIAKEKAEELRIKEENAAKERARIAKEIEDKAKAKAIKDAKAAELAAKKAKELRLEKERAAAQKAAADEAKAKEVQRKKDLADKKVADALAAKEEKVRIAEEAKIAKDAKDAADKLAEELKEQEEVARKAAIEVAKKEEAARKERKRADDEAIKIAKEKAAKVRKERLRNVVKNNQATILEQKRLKKEEATRAEEKALDDYRKAEAEKDLKQAEEIAKLDEESARINKEYNAKVKAARDAARTKLEEGKAAVLKKKEENKNKKRKAKEAQDAKDIDELIKLADKRDARRERRKKKESGILTVEELAKLTEAETGQVVEEKFDKPLEKAEVEDVLTTEGSREIDEVVEEAIEELTNEEVEQIEIAKAEEGSDESNVDYIKDKVHNAISGVKSIPSRISSIIAKIVKKVLMVTFVVNIIFGAGMINSFIPSTLFPSDPNIEAIANPDVSDISFYNSLTTDAQLIYESQLDNGKAYIIAEKQSGQIHMIGADNMLIKSVPSLFGRATGDETNNFFGKDAQGNTTRDKSKAFTPSGSYKLAKGSAHGIKSYHGNIFHLIPTDGSVKIKGGVLALHETYSGNLQERTRALNSPTVSDNRQSGGCINVGAENFEKYIHGNFSAGTQLFITPDAVHTSAPKTINIGQELTNDQIASTADFKDFYDANLTMSESEVLEYYKKCKI